MRVLVLGGSYFVGRHIAMEFHDAGHDVVLLNRGTREMPLPVLKADRNDIVALRAALAGQRFDVVIDTSCYDSGQAFLAVQALAGRYGRWIFVSSPAVYDDDASRPLVESANAEGSGHWGDHGGSKARSEALLRELCGPKLTILRPGYVYGPYNSMARETYVWSRVLRGRPMFVPGNGSTQVSFVHAADLAAVVHGLAANDAGRGGIYNVAHPEPVSFLRWVQIASEAAGARARVVGVPASMRIPVRDFFPFRDQPLALDVSRLKAETGLEPILGLHEGLTSTYASYSRPALESMARESSVDLELSLALLGVA
jgi:nucleoside-diphosphate-sugar epimerase